MAKGCRVRLLLEWYDEDWTEAEGNHMLDFAKLRTASLFKGAELQGYVEMNPPDDEVGSRRDANAPGDAG